MNKYPSAIVLMLYGVACITIGALLVYFGEQYDKSFSSPPPRVPVSVSPVLAGSAGPGRIMRVSAYCPKKCCCGKFADGYTASGVPAVGKIVAAPPTIPYGYVLSIPGYSEHAVVQDRGGAITGNRLDILFTDKDGISGHRRALDWGVQELMVKEIRDE